MNEKKIICGAIMLMFVAMASCNTYPSPDFEHMPQDRARWENPAGYGLPKEVGR